VVIGAGITGLTTALLLAEADQRVAVLEAHRVGEGASGNNTAKVSALQATKYRDITQRHGPEAAAGYADAVLAGVDLVADLVARNDIDCAARRVPAYTFAMHESGERLIAPVAERAHRLASPADDFVVRWALLVDAAVVSEVDNRVAELSRDEPRVSVTYVGPLPVFTFLDEIASSTAPAANRWGW
jgi:glycine/D-amino acid oxidase-like deaminating enzyme